MAVPIAVALVAFTAIGFVPYVGGLLQFVVLLVGLGAFVFAIRDRRAGRDDGDAASPSGEDDAGPSEGAPVA